MANKGQTINYRGMGLSSRFFFFNTMNPLFFHLNWDSANSKGQVDPVNDSLCLIPSYINQSLKKDKTVPIQIGHYAVKDGLSTNQDCFIVHIHL